MPQEKTLLKILKDLVMVPSADVDACVMRALGQLSAQLGGGRIWLFRETAPAVFASVVFHAPQPVAPMGSLAVDALLEPFLPRLAAGDVITPADLLALAPDSPVRLALAGQALASGVIAPAACSGRLYGFLLVECSTAPAAWLQFLPDLAELMLGLLARRDAEREQAETASRLTAMVKALPELLFEVDSFGCYTGFCVGPVELMVRPADTLAGRHLSDVMPAPVVDLCLGALHDTLEKGQVTGVIYELDLPVGRRVFELTGSRKPSAKPGQPPTAMFLVRDVTQNHRLREELQRFGSVVQAMSNLVAIVDLEQRVTWVNPAFERHTGWALDEIKGKPLADLVRCPDSDPAVVTNLELSLRTLKPFTGQILNQDRRGRRYWVDFNVRPLRDREGKVAGFVSVETVVTKMKEQEAAMAEMAQAAAAAHIRLENAIQALPDPAAVFDATERLVVCNPAFARTFPGLGGKAVPGVRLSELLAEGARQGIFRYRQGDDLEEWVDGALRAYRQPHYVDEMELPDGRWLRRVHNRTSDGGQICIGLDITARHRHMAAMDAANRELTDALGERDQARQRLMSIMEGAQVGTWELHVPSGLTTIGGHWAHILGREDEGLEVVTHDFIRSLIHPEDLPMFDDHQVLAPEYSHRVFELEFRMLHRDGTWVSILSRGRIVERGPQGQPLRIVGVHLDVSDRKRLEREVRVSESYLSSAMESSVSAIAIFDADGVLDYCNREAEHILGLTPGHYVGRDPDGPQWVMEFPDGTPMTKGDGPCEMARNAATTVRDIRFAVRWPDGQRKVLTSNASPVAATEAGKVVVSFWDITDQLAATATLEAALEHAEEMSRAKSVFLANMSHEIRTPLNGVLGMAEVLGMQLDDPDQKRMITTIRNSGETLLTVLNSILDMSKIEAGKMAVEQVPVFLPDLIAQIQAVYAIQTEEKGLEFDVLASTGCDIPRLGDPHRITQILHNLLNNAVKFTAQGGITLKVSARRGKPIVFEVRDTGTGMTEEQSARVFDSFVQADGSTTRRFGGTGLGLSIVRELVSLMGGEVAVQSVPGEGTRFTVTLPLAELDDGPARPAIAPPEAEPNLGPMRVLIADDNATNREILDRMLGRWGVTLVQAEDGVQAIDRWREGMAAGRPFDLMLLDISMPNMDGSAALAEIRKLEIAGGHAPARIVAATGHGQPEQVTALLQQGFDAHLVKPISGQDLRRAITALVPKVPVN